MARRKRGSGGAIVLGLIGLGIYGLFGGHKSETPQAPSPARLVSEPVPAERKAEPPPKVKVGETKPSKERASLTVTVQSLRIRSAPSGTAPIVGRLSRGDQVEAKQQTGTWIEVAREGAVLGWVSEDGFSAVAAPPKVAKPKLETVLTAAAIAALLVKASRQDYYASGRPCACPDDVMRNGRRCGSRSAYSRPGGASPLCYPGDVTSGMIEAFRARQASRQ